MEPTGAQMALIIQRIEELGRQLKASADEAEKAELAKQILELCAEWRQLEEALEQEKKQLTGRRKKTKPDLLDLEDDEL